MAAESVLAREVIEILTKGMKKAEAEIDGLKKKLVDVDKQGKSLSERLEGVGRFAVRGFALASAGLGLFIRAGLQETREGERVQRGFRHLSQEVTGVFLPTIDKATGLMEHLAGRLSILDGAQQANIRRWAESTVAGLGLASALSKVNPLLGVAAAGFVSLAGASEQGRDSIDNMSRSLTELGKSLGPTLGAGLNAVSNQVSDVAKNFDSLLKGDFKNAGRGFLSVLTAGNLVERFGRGELFKPSQPGSVDLSKLIRRDVTPVEPKRGSEDITGSFKRLQLAALSPEGSIEKQQLDKLEQIRLALERLGASPAAAQISVGAVAAVGV